MSLSCVLAEVYRGEFLENQHQGWLVVSDTAGNILYSTPGALDIQTFFRSAAKPFQALPLIVTDFHRLLSPEELAIVCASHSGTSGHLRLAQQILDKAGLQESSLQCGPHYPMSKDATHALIRENLSPRKLHNNCSGKHAGMLFCCCQKGWPIESYLDSRHPLQKQIIQSIQEWCGLSEPLKMAVDGCGAPTFYLPLVKMAQLYAKLSVSEQMAPVVQAMTSYPFLVAGVDRVDALIMKASEGKLLAKVGADGVMAVCHVGRGEGFIIKMADGNGKIRDWVTLYALRKLGWLTETAWQDPLLKPYQIPSLRNTQDCEVGAYRFHLGALS